MNIAKSLGIALRLVRLKKAMTQEDFSQISSRTYISVLENGRKSPSFEKVGVLSNEMGVHPLTLITLAYMNLENKELQNLVALIEKEITDIKG